MKELAKAVSVRVAGKEVSGFLGADGRAGSIEQAQEQRPLSMVEHNSTIYTICQLVVFMRY